MRRRLWFAQAALISMARLVKYCRHGGQIYVTVSQWHMRKRQHYKQTNFINDRPHQVGHRSGTGVGESLPDTRRRKRRDCKRVIRCTQKVSREPDNRRCSFNGDCGVHTDAGYSAITRDAGSSKNCGVSRSLVCDGTGKVPALSRLVGSYRAQSDA
jgi:hypothetical protein